jgi:CRP-like cAMP-binding protein
MVAPHTPIVVAGESATAMYFVVSGLAKVTGPGKGRGGGWTLGTGDVIAAEVALNGGSHEATIFAHTPMRLLALSSQDLVILLRKFPRLRRRIQKTSFHRPKKTRRQQSTDEAISQIAEEDEAQAQPIDRDL